MSVASASSVGLSTKVVDGVPLSLDSLSLWCTASSCRLVMAVIAAVSVVGVMVVGGEAVAGSQVVVRTGMVTGMYSDRSSQGEEARSVISSLLIVGITMVWPSSSTMVSLTTPTSL
ncbi:hypothetical protein EYF80_025014 [Liparis tanakae]|uniref:Uncharacterized protein n=1 Tax=Liparis tanakae TaxID=230148 RepID=A0A4Z2HG31_9TELE|nr:hypothetical protein EYF80_025014 [Liparis tanakae]